VKLNKERTIKDLLCAQQTLTQSTERSTFVAITNVLVFSFVIFYLCDRLFLLHISGQLLVF